MVNPPATLCEAALSMREIQRTTRGSPPLDGEQHGVVEGITERDRFAPVVWSSDRVERDLSCEDTIARERLSVIHAHR